MLENNKKFRVIEEGVMTNESMKKTFGGACGPGGMYGCSNDDPSSFVIKPCARDLLTCSKHFFNCPVLDKGYSSCHDGFATCSCKRHDPYNNTSLTTP